MTVGPVLFWRDFGDGFAYRDIARIVPSRHKRAGLGAGLSGLVTDATQHDASVMSGRIGCAFRLVAR